MLLFVEIACHQVNQACGFEGAWGIIKYQLEGVVVLEHQREFMFCVKANTKDFRRSLIQFAKEFSGW